MKKVCCFYAIILIAITASAQYQNPGARLERLKVPKLTKESIYKWVKSDLEFIQIQKHDTIADIGTFDGYYPLLYSIFSDSAVFYLNDLTTAGFSYFDTIQGICTALKGSPLSNQYKLIIGNDSCTNLPKHLFTKVILQDALHHFKLMDKMLSDIRDIISPQPGSKLLLYETIRGGENNDKLCRGAMTREDLLKLLDRNGFSFSKEFRRGDSLGRLIRCHLSQAMGPAY